MNKNAFCENIWMHLRMYAFWMRVWQIAIVLEWMETFAFKYTDLCLCAKYL